jgi:hypothetical protein
MPGSANGVSLEQAQHNFIEFGTAERRHRGGGREPFDEESRDAAWRLLDPARDKFAGSEFGQWSGRRWPRSGEPQGRGEHNVEEPQRGIDYGESYPFADTTVLYYWRETYWRRLAS